MREFEEKEKLKKEGEEWAEMGEKGVREEVGMKWR